MIDEALYQMLSTDAQLANAVGSRIYPLMSPERPTYPLVVYQRMARTPVRAMRSDSALVGHAYQLTAWSRSYTSSRDVGELVRNAVQDKSGTFAGVDVQRVFVDDARAIFDPTSQAFGFIVEVTIWASAS